MKGLYIHYRDLRAYDLEAVAALEAQGHEICHLISWPQILGQSTLFRRKFLYESTLELVRELIIKQRKFYVTDQSPEDFIKMNQDYKLMVIEQCFEFDENKQLENLKKISSEMKINLVIQKPNTIFDLSFLSECYRRPPGTFTDFRKALEKKIKYQKIDFVISELKPHQDFDIHRLQNKELIEGPSRDSDNIQLLFKPGPKAAHNHLENYFSKTEAVLNYKKTRNDLLEFDSSTKFSPYLSIGALSARLVFKRLKNFEEEVEANDSTYWIWFELLWREYFKIYSYIHLEKIFLLKGLQPTKNLELASSDEQHQLFKSWISGKTKDEFVNANMIELNQTGWMSNRGRQNVASYLAKTLCVDWRWGARYFESMLIDYDAANNWGNWNYITGVGSDPRDRIFNTVKQAQDYDPLAQYRRKWLAHEKS